MKQTNLIILIIFILLIGCSANANRRNINTYNKEYNPNHYSFERYKKDTIGYCEFQTFDEYLMQGKGRVYAEPYVYIKRIKDTIIVKCSSSIDSMRVYYKLSCGTWYSHMEYEMWKINGYIPVKSEWDKFARSYDRFFYNDTILEIQKLYTCKNDSSLMAIVKTGNSVFTVNHFDYIGSVEKLRSKMYSLTNTPTCTTARRYSVIETKDSIFYISDSKKYKFRRNSLGLWGIQPGVDETYIFEGQDIRNFTHDHPNGIVLENDTVIYELADQMPQYPGGIEEFTKISHVTIRNQTVTTNKRIRVVVECVVEKDGSLSNLWINKRNILEYDEKAIDIVKKIARFTPAVLNGEKVRCKIQIPITFLFKQ